MGAVPTAPVEGGALIGDRDDGSDAPPGRGGATCESGVDGVAAAPGRGVATSWDVAGSHDEMGAVLRVDLAAAAPSSNEACRHASAKGRP